MVCHPRHVIVHTVHEFQVSSVQFTRYKQLVGSATIGGRSSSVSLSSCHSAHEAKCHLRPSVAHLSSSNFGKAGLILPPSLSHHQRIHRCAILRCRRRRNPPTSSLHVPSLPVLHHADTLDTGSCTPPNPSWCHHPRCSRRSPPRSSLHAHVLPALPRPDTLGSLPRNRCKSS